MTTTGRAHSPILIGAGIFISADRAVVPLGALAADLPGQLVALAVRYRVLAGHVVEQLVTADAGGAGQARGTAQDRADQSHGAVGIHGAQCPPLGGAPRFSTAQVGKPRAKA